MSRVFTETFIASVRSLLSLIEVASPAEYLVKKLQKDSNNKKNSRDRDNEEPDFLAFTVSDTKDKRKNAEVMQRLLTVYLEVANRRILDSIPMILRCTQHKQFVEKLQHRLQTICSGDEVASLVQEEPQLLIDRKRHKARSERLTHAMEKLNNMA